MKWLNLAIGSIAGGFSRYFVAGFVHKTLGTSFPYGTLAVNLSGCFLVGIFYALAEDKLLLGADEKLLLITGFCGAFTTFSAFMLETSNLARDGQPLRAAMNIGVSVAFGFLLFRLGAHLGRAI